MLDEECAAFRASVERFLHKQKRKLVNKHGKLPSGYTESVQEANHLTDHAIHILSTLTVKRESLSNAIYAFQILCDDIIVLMKSHQHYPSGLKPILKDIFMHFFIQYIHIRDGFVLLTSGECRHNGDADLAKKNHKFRSRLSTLSNRNDGYTKMYSSNRGYSGWGWDEFHNEDIGIRRLLLDQLRICCHPKKIDEESHHAFLHGEGSSQSREKIWERLLESGAQSFESAFDQHENEMKELQAKIESLRSTFMSNVETCLSFPGFVMVLEDKFERLQLKSSNSLGFSEFMIQRQGDAFLGTDDKGALPSGASKEYWISKLRLPDTLRSHQIKKKMGNLEDSEMKRRRVIHDSDDESSKEKTNHVASSKDYLKVSVKTAAPKKSESSSESIFDIKRGYGFNSSNLEISREELEKEESGTIVAAHVDEMSEIMRGSVDFPKEHEITPEISQILDVIQNEMDNCDKFRTRLKFQINDEYEKWDAREALRFSLMRLGNAYLEYHDMIRVGNAHVCLSLAKSSFQEALHVIKELENLNNMDKCEDIEKQFRKRAVLLCRGRCLANLGKTSFEQADILTNSKLLRNSRQHGQIVLKQALKYLRVAETCAQSLHSQAADSIPMDLRTMEQKLDAEKLSCMACHLQAFAFLSLERVDQCIISILKASGLRAHKNSYKVPQLFEEDDVIIARSKLHILEDLYDGSIAAISIISTLLQDRYRYMNSTNEDAQAASMFASLCEAYDQAAALSDIISNYSRDDLNEDIENILAKENMFSSQDILEFKSNDIEVYKYESQKSSEKSKQSLLAETTKRKFPFPRNDIFRNSISNTWREPTQRILVAESITSGSRDNSILQNKSGDQSKIVEKTPDDDLLDEFFSKDLGTVDDFDVDQIEESCDIYFQWGNELFAEKGLDPNAYPNCEPVKPPEMIEELGLEHM